MKMRLFILSGVAAIVLIAVLTVSAEAETSIKNSRSAPAVLLRRCEKNYSDDELADLIANGEDGYEPDDCPFLAHTLTGPMGLNFCQPGDEDWVMFKAQSNVIYQIRAEPQGNFPTEPHLDLMEIDGKVIARNDHYFGNNAEIWFWNSSAERFFYIRATELRGRHDCGNSAYTLTLHAFTENPYPPATVLPTSTQTLTPSPTPTATSVPSETPAATLTPGG